MNRKSFLVQAVILIVGLSLVFQTESCRKKDEAGQVDFTLDLNDPRYSTLNSTGNFVVVNNVIIARGQNGGWLAVSSQCTYDGSTLTFDPFSNEFVCPSDQSKFDINGNPTFGFANQPLIKYYTQLYGSSLRVYL